MITMSDVFEKLEDKDDIGFYRIGGGKWRANQKVKIDGKIYEENEFVPQEYSRNYKISNGLTSYWNRVHSVSEETGKSISETRENLRESKKINKFYSKYDHVYMDDNGMLRDTRNGRFVKEDDFLSEMKEEYPEILKEKDREERIDEIDDIKKDWWY